MKKTTAAVCVLFLSGLSFFSGPAAARTVDRVVAVVGGEAILSSELDGRVAMAKMQFPELKNDKSLREKVLNSLIDQKVILTKAKIDSTGIDDGMLDALVAERMKALASRFSSPKEMEASFGKSSLVIRRELRQELKNQQLIETLRRKKMAGISVSRAETMAFYEAYKGRLPVVPEAVSISQIVKYPDVSAESRANARARIEKVQAELSGGADFSALAKQYSQDPGSAPVGGDLGHVQRGELVQSFEDAAFALKEGKVSDIVETRYGFHIIQLISKEHNSLHVRHILAAFDRSKSDVAGTTALLRSIRADVLAGKASFADMARKHSDDRISARRGGEVFAGVSPKNVFPVASLRSPLKEIVAKLRTEGSISEPVTVRPPQGGEFYGIFRLNERVPAHQLDPGRDYAALENLALDYKRQRVFEAWLQQLRKEVVVRRSDV